MKLVIRNRHKLVDWTWIVTLLALVFILIPFACRTPVTPEVLRIYIPLSCFTWLFSAWSLAWKHWLFIEKSPVEEARGVE